MADVVLSREEFAALVTDAMAWRELMQSEHVRDLIEEYREWRRRRDLSESTAAMAGLEDWRRVAEAPTYGELQRRRSTYDRPALTPEQIRARAQASAAAFDTTTERTAA